MFVARRHEIVFLKPTFAGDLLRVVTWLGEPRGARVDRQYLVFRELGRTTDVPVRGRPVIWSVVAGDGLLAARATTEWVFASNQGQPRRIPSEIVSVFRAGTREGTDGIRAMPNLSPPVQRRPERGSRASCSPSPRTLKAKTVRVRARPGNVVYHHASRK